MKIDATDRTGFTLIEVLVALAIFSFGALAVIGFFTASIGSNAQGRHVTEATNLAQSKLDYLLTSEGYEDLGNGLVSGIQPQVDEDGNPTGQAYAVSWETTPINTAGLDMKMITVTVSWVSKGFEHHVTQSVIRTADK